MLKIYFPILVLCFLAACQLSQKIELSSNETHQTTIQAHQDHLNKEYAEAETSPLDSVDLVNFEALEFFPINPAFRVVAQFKEQTSDVFKMATTTDRAPEYRKYGVLLFKLQGKRCRLNIYQNIQLSKTEKYKNYLFVPFTDATNGTSSYGGGRYIDFEIPQDKYVVLDFNKAYNPYCAYSSRYSCPIPPKENDLDIAIKAGIKAWDKH